MRRDLYKVPDIKPKELVDYFTEIQVQIQLEDILRPTPHTTYTLFASLVGTFQGESIAETLLRTKYTPENEETLKIVLLHKRMSHFLARIGIFGFSLVCVAQPEQKKVISILSVVMNFSIYRDNKRELYERVCLAVQERQKFRMELMQRAELSRKEIEMVRNKIEGNNKVRIEEEKEIERLDTILRDKYRELRGLATEIEKTKQNKTHTADLLSENQLKIVNCKQEILNLKTQVLLNPEQLIEELENMKLLILNENEDAKKIMNEKKEILKKTQNFIVLIERLKNINKSAVAVKQSTEKIEEFNNKNDKLELKIGEVKQQIKSMQLKADHLGRQISHLETKIFNIQNLSEQESERVGLGLEEIKEKYEKISTERNNSNSMLIDNISKSKKLEINAYFMEKEHNNRINDILNALKGFKSRFISYSCNTERLFK